jgi:branched-chain amino acid transport system permease protein
VGGGLFTGTALIGPINVLTAVAPWSQNLVAMLPGLAGLGLGHYPDGVVSGLRGRWEPVVRDRLALSGLLGGLGLAYALWLGGAINGWTFSGGSLVLALALRGWATTRQAAAATVGAEPEIPVEWWGVRRDWRPEDEEVMDRGIAAHQ